MFPTNHCVEGYNKKDRSLYKIACAQIYTIDYKNANETLTKTLKYLHRNITRHN